MLSTDRTESVVAQPEPQFHLRCYRCERMVEVTEKDYRAQVELGWEATLCEPCLDRAFGIDEDSEINRRLSQG